MATLTVAPRVAHNGQALTLQQHPQRDFQTYIVDQPERGFFTIDRSLFTDPEIFELEMEYIFEGGAGYTSRMRASSPGPTISSPPRWDASRSS